MRSAVFVSDRNSHASRAPDGQGCGRGGVRLADGVEPADATLGSRVEATIHELGALIV